MSRCPGGIRAVVATFALMASVALAADAPIGYLGAAVGELPTAGQDEPVGTVVVTAIVEGSPAEKAGLRARDVVVGVDGLDVASPAELIQRIRSLPPNSSVGLRIVRRGVERQLDVRLGTRPDDESSMRYLRGWIGVRTIELPPSLRTRFGAPEDAGVMVSALEEGGPAEVAGVEIGDVIYAVEGDPVTATSTLMRLIARSGVGGPVALSVGRDGAQLELEPIVARAPSRSEN